MEVIMTQRKYYVFTFCFLFFTFQLIAQPGWIQNYQPFSTPYYDYSYTAGNINIDSDGGFVVNGTCHEHDPDIGWYSEWGFIMKTDNEGNVLWETRDSLSYETEPPYDTDSYAFCIMPNGGYVCAGIDGLSTGYILFRNENAIIFQEILYTDEYRHYTSAYIGSDNNSVVLCGIMEGSTSFIQKFDLQGNEIWCREHTNYGEFISLISTSDGGYAIGAYHPDFKLNKFDSEGYFEWTQNYDYNNQFDELNSITQTSDDGYLLCGYTDNPDRGGFIVKTDTTGDTLWTKKFDIEYCSRVYSANESESSYTFLGHSYGGIVVLFAINMFGSNLWYEEIPSYGYSFAERSMQQTYDNGFILYLTRNDYFLLIKTDENGIVSIYYNEIEAPNNLILRNHPNPFNPSTTINYELPANIENATLEIFNIKGKKIRTFNCHNQIPIIWDGTDYYNNQVSSGVYLYCIKSDECVLISKKMLLLK